MASDGKIIIDATINHGDFAKSVDKLEKTVSRSAKNMSDSLDDVTTSAGKIVIEPTTKGIREAEKELQGLEKQYEELAAAADEAKQMMDFATDGGRYDNSITRQIVKDYTDAAKAVDDTAVKIFGLEDAVAGAKVAMEQGKRETEAYKEETKRMADAQREAERQTKALETLILSDFSRALSQAKAKMDELVTSTFDFRQEMAMVETNLSRMGQNLEDAEKYMAQFSVVSSNTSQNLSAVSNLLDTGLEGDKLATAIDAVSGAVIAFPDQNVQRISEGIQRTFGEGKAVGNFAELIRRTGGDVDKFNEKMGRANTDAAKQNIIMRELSRMGLGGVLKQYQELHPELVEATQAQYDYNSAMARLGDALQPAKSAVDGVKASVAGFAAGIVESQPGLATFVYGLTTVASEGMKVVSFVAEAKRSISILLGPLSQVGTLAGDTAGGMGKMATQTTNAGNAAQKVNMQFLVVAGGIAIIAAGVAVAVVAITQLVKALGGGSDSAVEMAVGVGIIIGAITVMLTAMILLSKVVGNNSSQFVVYAAAIMIVASAFSLMMTAITGLVKEMGDSDHSFSDMANGISRIALSMALLIGVVAVLGAALSKHSASILLLSVVFGILALSMAAVISASARLAQAEANRAKAQAEATRATANALKTMSSLAEDLPGRISAIAAAVWGLNEASKNMNAGPLQKIVGLLTLSALEGAVTVVNNLADALERMKKSLGGGNGALSPLRLFGGYARGTQSARRGYNWVDETTSPQLLWFNGGEVVMNRSQAMARQGALNASGGARTAIHNTTVSFTIPADQIDSFARLVRQAESESVQIQQGVDMDAY